MIRAMVRRLSETPLVFDALRWILEGGFIGHRSIFESELAERSGLALDLGCGTGQWSSRFASDKYLGVDLVPEYLIAAKRKHPSHEYILADGCRLPLSDQSVSLILISGVLHHLDETIARHVLLECSRVLRNDGRLVVWEDVPVPVWRNPIGHLAHCLDNGSFIREADQYVRLLEHRFKIRSTRKLRSGFMNYVVFDCRLASGQSA